MFNKNSRPLEKIFLGEMERVKRGDGVMKKLLLIMPLLMLGMHSINAMLGKSESRYNPFDKFKALKAPQLTEDQLLQVIKRGDYDALVQELLRGLNAKYIFETGEFKGKSLLQVALGHSMSNRYDIASRLLKEGANTADLNEFIKVAVKTYNSQMLKWLLEHGAKDDSVYAVVEILEKGAQGLRKEELIKIKELLRPQQTVVVPAAIAKPKASETSKTELPVVVAQPVKTQPVKKDAFTVLAEADEQKLFNALLSGNEKKVAEYLEMGVSPNFVFWKGASGKSLLQVAVTQTLNNQEKIADLLLQYGADSQALSDGLILAVERFDKPKVEWLLAKGAPVTAQLKEKIQDLEKNNTHPVKQKKLAEIKTLVEKQRIPVAPVVTQFVKPLPPVPGKKPQQ